MPESYLYSLVQKPGVYMWGMVPTGHAAVLRLDPGHDCEVDRRKMWVTSAFINCCRWSWSSEHTALSVRVHADITCEMYGFGSAAQGCSLQCQHPIHFIYSFHLRHFLSSNSSPLIWRHARCHFPCVIILLLSFTLLLFCSIPSRRVLA